MKKIHLVFFSLAVLFTTNCYQGMDDHHKRDGKHFKKRIHKMHSKLVSKLDLTEEQEKSLKMIAGKLLEKKQSLKMRETRKKERKLLYESITQKKIQTDELKNLQKEKADKKIKFRNFQIEQYSEFYESLTEKQKDKLIEIFKHRRRWNHEDDDEKNEDGE